MLDRGKLVIIVIFGLAGLATLYAWCYRVHLGRRALDFWGSDVAMLIRHSDRVELTSLVLAQEGIQGERLEASAGGQGGERLMVDGRVYRVRGWLEITEAPGMLNARQALVEDASFLWDEPPNDDGPNWEYALRFSRPTNQAIVLVDFTTRRLRRLDATGELVMGNISEGLKTFVQEQGSPTK